MSASQTGTVQPDDNTTQENQTAGMAPPGKQRGRGEAWKGGRAPPKQGDEGGNMGGNRGNQTRGPKGNDDQGLTGHEDDKKKEEDKQKKKDDDEADKKKKEEDAKKAKFHKEKKPKMWRPKNCLASRYACNRCNINYIPMDTRVLYHPYDACEDCEQRETRCPAPQPKEF